MTSHLLAIDVGNTKIVLGLFHGDELVAHWRAATRLERTADEYAALMASFFSQRGLAFGDVGGCVIGSVMPPLLPVFHDICQRYLSVAPLVVGPGVRTEMRIRIDDPRELGADRIANAVATRKLYGSPAIVIDFSTAIAFDAISAEGDFLGVALAPGIAIAADALFRHTAQLRRIELVPPPKTIGTNTVASLQSGLVYGYVGLVEGMVARFQRELGGNARVIATGEEAPVIARETDVIEVVDADLTLVGLRLLWRMNRE